MGIIHVWDEGRTGLWTPNGTKNIPQNYEYLPSGDAALTRAVMKAMGRKRAFVVMKKVSKRYPSRQIGAWALASVIAAERERLAAMRTDDRKKMLAEQRKKKQERDINTFGAVIIQRFPICPADEAQVIAAHACEVGSGRVGRSSTADDPVRAAVVAHIRHEHTEYDELLSGLCAYACDRQERDEARQEAREQVRHQIDVILRLWEAQGAISDEALVQLNSVIETTRLNTEARRLK